jgi:hypothetical protein
MVTVSVPLFFHAEQCIESSSEKVHMFERTSCAPAQGTPMRTALHLWVSTAQHRPDLQADGVHRYAKRAGLDTVAEPMNMAISGRQEGRAQLQALVGAARHHEFAYVLVRKLDHLNTHAN